MSAIEWTYSQRTYTATTAVNDLLMVKKNSGGWGSDYRRTKRPWAAFVNGQALVRSDDVIRVFSDSAAARRAAERAVGADAQPTMQRVNKALAAANYPVELVKGDGYFWFARTDQDPDKPGFDDIPSIYSNHLRGMTVAQYVEHVADHVEKIA